MVMTVFHGILESLGRSEGSDVVSLIPVNHLIFMSLIIRKNNSNRGGINSLW